MDWVNNQKTIEKSRKWYSHFDCRTDMRVMADYVVVPEKIEKHSFYPFIHYVMEMDKYNSKKGRVPKKRDIYYASHRDRCVFQYYAYLINEKYNQYVLERGMDKVAVAYRNNLRENNIISSKRAFDYIKALGNSYVMIGDFKNFFDRLNHAYLKKQLNLVLGTDELPRDYYTVYKNVTRYAYVDIEDILRINRLNNDKKGRRILNKNKTVLTKEQFNEHRHDIVHKNEAKYGIPQGSPISAVLANVYMVTVDKAINDYVTKLNGFYMRYSDDFIVIIPYEEDYKAVFEHIRDLLDGVPDLILEPNKTPHWCLTPLRKYYKNRFVLGLTAQIFDDKIRKIGFIYRGYEN